MHLAEKKVCSILKDLLEAMLLCEIFTNNVRNAAIKEEIERKTLNLLVPALPFPRNALALLRKRPVAWVVFEVLHYLKRG